ncbi:unnamed protein product [Rotaria sordida]|uniref:Chromatin target of PRMT1 protein C-terminal domain-containing protein n=1 Tax=Rotaria sordida TaxID=392033 RepID=A0A813MYU5_9BILA|nr:unnamed protein product [Rotaria sordida]CAF0943199.1 unnamed protein product [Rotaria sordida]
MITGKIILKSATKLTLDQRFSEIAKQPVPIPRIQQQTNVTIPKFRQELFGNKPSATLSAANRLKKRSINYRLGFGNNAAIINRQYTNPRTAPVFQRISLGNRRRGGSGGNSFLYGGQSGMGLRLRGQGRVGTRIFRSRTRGYLNNNTISRFSGFNRRGNNNKNNRGRRFGNRPNRGRPNANRNFMRGRGNGRNQNRNKNNNKNNINLTKENLDNDLEKYMAKTNIDNNSIEMNTI